ncbi:MAG: hypothetical protein M1821_003146 [Bathelium mastoideum]|nr:MAG: hypothetical protein M1821_003146 [Bathelium mastoideum]KAI9688176.1 MAG: hypothetical protein M1822_001682 [Bathelium mastoideum]
MDMEGMDGMDMSGMEMGPGVPSLPYMQQMYWALVGTVIGIATVFNALNWVNYRQRLSAASKGLATPAKPKSWFWRSYATLTAINRETAYASFAPIRINRFTLRSPRLGRTALIIGNIIVLLVLCFYKLPTNQYTDYEDIGYRTGFINICQLPLLFLLAGKNNIIGVLTGFSFEKLNWIHRWVARCLLLTVTIHMGYWFADWAPYDYITVKIKTDDITQYGMAAWAILLWIVFSSMTPIRGWCYEFFVIQHIISFSGFLAVVWLHVPAGPSGPRYWVYICIALVCIDRLMRLGRVLWINLSFLHRKQQSGTRNTGIFSCQAEFTPLAHETTRITIRNPPISWRPGQFVFLSCHSIVPLQSHPLTIASIPEDGQLEFIVKCNKGATRSFFRHATKNGRLPSSTADMKIALGKVTTIEGPYGKTRPLQQFDSVVLFAGSTGATFTMPLMRNLVASWRRARNDPKQPGSSLAHKISVTRRIRCVWVIKSKGQLEWFSSQLTQVIKNVEELRDSGADVMVDISIYVTCDDTFTSEHTNAIESHRHSNGVKHGVVEEISASGEKVDAKFSEKVEQREVKEVSSDTSSENGEQSKSGCGPDGTCCCRATVDDEDAIASAVCTCNAARSHSSSSAEASSVISRSSSSAGQAKKKPLPVHPNISVVGGRPQPRNIIRKSLEQAYGESAVVVCGPKGLVDDVRMSTVGLSDERAVHKGTGAQGICLITEYFGY